MSSNVVQRWLIIGLLISNALLIAFLIFGNPRFRSPPPPEVLIIERLDLSPTQIDAFKNLIADHQRRIRAIDQQINDKKHQLYIGLKDSSINEPILLGQLAILQTEAEEEKLDHFRQIKALCRPKQVASFDALTEELGNIFSRGQRPPPASREQPR